MERLFISCPMHLISSQYHVGKASKSSRYVVAVSGGCYDIIAGMLFTLGTLAQVGEHPKDLERSLDAQEHPPPWPPS